MVSRINETEYSDGVSHLIHFLRAFHELFIKPWDKDNLIQVMELFKQFVEGSFSKYSKDRVKNTNELFADCLIQIIRLSICYS